MPRKASVAVRAARTVGQGTVLRAVYWGPANARPCFFRVRKVPRGSELRLFATAPSRRSRKARGWCVGAHLAERLQGGVLVLVREHGRKPLGPAGLRQLASGRDCRLVPLHRWPERKPRGASRPEG